MGELRTALAKARAEERSTRQDSSYGFQKPLEPLDVHSKAAAWAWLVHHGLGKNSSVPSNTRVIQSPSRFKVEATRKVSDFRQSLFDQYLFDQYELSRTQAKSKESKRIKVKDEKTKGASPGLASCFAILSRPPCVRITPSDAPEKSSRGSKSSSKMKSSERTRKRRT